MIHAQSMTAHKWQRQMKSPDSDWRPIISHYWDKENGQPDRRPIQLFAFLSTAPHNNRPTPSNPLHSVNNNHWFRLIKTSNYHRQNKERRNEVLTGVSVTALDRELTECMHGKLTGANPFALCDKNPQTSYSNRDYTFLFFLLNWYIPVIHLVDESIGCVTKSGDMAWRWAIY